MNTKGLSKFFLDEGLEQIAHALGGPLAGVVVDMLADLLGTSRSPAEIEKTVREGGASVEDALQRIEAAPETAKAAQARFQMLAAQSDAVNQTMRAELSGQSWFQRAWRPFFAFAFTIAFAAFMGATVFAIVLAVRSAETGVLIAVAELCGAMSFLWAGGFGVLGVFVSGRSKEKRAAMTGGSVPGIFGGVVDKLRKGFG